MILQCRDRIVIVPHIASYYKEWYDCCMRRSITVFPKLTGNEVSSIEETRKQYARAFNMSAECLINNNSTSKRFLHKVQYERIKEECPSLPEEDEA